MILIFYFSVPTSGHPSRPLSQPHGDRAGKSFGRNPSIKISRATRVSEQWNASLDREITNANELRHLDEFLGNQVNKSRAVSILYQIIWIYLPRYPNLILYFSVGQWFPLQGEAALSHRGHLCYSHYAVQREYQSHVFPHSKSFSMSIIHTDQGSVSPSSFSLLSDKLHQKPTIGYKGLMTGYQNKVIHLAGDKQKGEVQLVVNLFQSVLDGFIRGEMKKEEAEPAKVKHWHYDCCCDVRIVARPNFIVMRHANDKTLSCSKYDNATYSHLYLFSSRLKLERREGKKIKAWVWRVN